MELFPHRFRLVSALATVRRLALLPLLTALSAPALAAPPPDLLNYQGVLRDAADRPLDGDFDMVFRFIDAAGGTEILVDRHDTERRVIVKAGLFNVALGGGEVSDGAGPGTYTTLSQVFRDFDDVLLRVEVDGETLSPDVRALSAGYALNATYLDGVFESQFLRSDENDTAVGKIFFAGTPSGSGISQGTVFISPTSAGADTTLLGVALNASERFKVDAEGDVSVSGTLRSTGGSGYGIDASGPVGGGRFVDANGTAEGWVALSGHGIHAHGATMGGEFYDTDQTGHGYVGYGDLGIYAQGLVAGGYFLDTNNASGVYVGIGAYKIQGPGAVSFVQNHPERPDRVIVYHAPESSEVAVYARGSGRLSGGFARVSLDPTFAWVANPDLGLTAHLTPRGDPVPLAVAALTTTDLEVRGPAGTELDFDYIVWGLRIGFEEMAPVQPKDREASIPSMKEHRDLQSAAPDLRSYNALERFKTIEAGRRGLGSPDAVDLSAGRRLAGRIGEFDPASGAAPLPSAVAKPEPAGADPRAGDVVESPPPPAAANQTTPAHAVMTLSMPAGPGEVLTLDPGRPGLLRPAASEADPALVGIATAPSTARQEPDTWEAPVATWGVVGVRADAGYGAIRPGDLLTSSPTPGHAMRATEAAPGTLLGKALDALEFGTGTIRLVVLLR